MFEKFFAPKRSRILEEVRFLDEHRNVGSVTLTADAYGRVADSYFSVFNDLVGDGKIVVDSGRVFLSRTPTGLELHVR